VLGHALYLTVGDCVCTCWAVGTVWTGAQ